jgi:PAS domain S-box-containing protein
MPSAGDIEAACQSLQQLKQQLKNIVRSGGGEPNLALLSAAADDSPDAVVVCNNHAEIRMVNGVAARMTGFTTRELQTLTIWDITHSESQVDFDVLWREFLRAGRQRGIYTLRRKNGDPVHLAYCSEIRVLDDLHVSVMRPPSR